MNQASLGPQNPSHHKSWNRLKAELWFGVFATWRVRTPIVWDKWKSSTNITLLFVMRQKQGSGNPVQITNVSAFNRNIGWITIPRESLKASFM
jgi:hypothetical protein